MGVYREGRTLGRWASQIHGVVSIEFCMSQRLVLSTCMVAIASAGITELCFHMHS